MLYKPFIGMDVSNILLKKNSKLTVTNSSLKVEKNYVPTEICGHTNGNQSEMVCSPCARQALSQS